MNALSRFEGLHWDPPGGLGWLFVLLALGAVVYAIYVYRKTDAPLSPRLRAVLTGLRALFLLVIIGILCRPVLSLAVPGGVERGVLVLLDRSSSMELPGADRDTRLEELGRARAALAEELSTLPTVVRPFGADLGAPLDAGEPLGPLDPRGTAISGAMETGVAHGGPGGRAGAVVLVTDGTQTQGPDPLPVARRMGLPVVPVALGRPDPVADLSLVRVRANRDAFAGERTPLEAVVRLQGLEPGTIDVRLLDVTGDVPVELATETVRVDPGGAERRVRIAFTPMEIGLRFLEVRVSELAGEATAGNNRRLVAVDVREEKTGVLLLSGGLTWDHTFVRRALASDSTLSTIAAYWSGGSFRPVDRGGSPPVLTADGLRGTRVVVLDHVRPAQLGAGGGDALAGFVRAGGGLILLSGAGDRALGAWAGTPLGQLLPVQLEQGAPYEVEVRLTADARRHALFDPSAPGAPSLETWSNLPPVLAAGAAGPVKGHAEALIVSRGGNAPVSLVSWAPAGQGRVLLFAGTGFWTWDFLASSHRPSGVVMPGWWRRAVQWMARPVVEARFDAHPDQFVVGRGDAVRFVARATDQNYRPLDDVDVTVEVRGAGDTGGASRTVELVGGEGFSSGSVAALEPGRYTFRASATASGAPFGTAEGVFVVDSLGAELERLEADHEFLARLAEATGTRVWTPDSLGGLAASLREAGRVEQELEQVDLWDHPLTFVLFVALGATEWLLRRRRGLI